MEDLTTTRHIHTHIPGSSGPCETSHQHMGAPANSTRTGTARCKRALATPSTRRSGAQLGTLLTHPLPRARRPQHLSPPTNHSRTQHRLPRCNSGSDCSSPLCAMLSRRIWVPMPPSSLRRHVTLIWTPVTNLRRVLLAVNGRAVNGRAHIVCCSCAGTMLAVHLGSPLIGPMLLYEEKSKTIAPGPSLIRQ